MEKQFTASFDNTVKIISALCGILLIVVPVFLFPSIHTSLLYKVGLTVFLYIIFVGCYVLSPSYYTLDRFNIMAYSRKGVVFVWPRKEIVSIKLLTREDLKFSLRILGVGGLFGYYGIYHNRSLGWMIWYGSQRKNYILLELQNGKKIILTPDNPQEFIAALKLPTA